MADKLEKRFYRPAEVAELVGVNASTLRFWEKEFPSLTPRRSAAGARRYTPDEVRRIQQIAYLLHTKGLKIEAAKRYLQQNPQDVDRCADALNRLRTIRATIADLLAAISPT